MNEVNPEKLKARAADIRESVAKIQAYSALPDSDFWADERNLYAIKYLLLQAMEALGSICVHVLAKRFQVAVSNYATCFEELEKKGVLSSDLSKKLRKMIRFRNILVHRYWEVDDQRVLEYARHDIQDIMEMLRAVWYFLGFSKE
jgi:uncharacterized protein YutE (UPF0331/DUF86 family)